MRALDRPADCTLHRRRARTCLASRIFGARECGDACCSPGRRAVVATGRLVPPPLVQPYNPTISKSLEQPATYLLLDKPLAYIAPLLPPAVAVLPDRRHRLAHHARRRVRPPHSHRIERSTAGRRMGIAHARQADPRTIAGAVWPPCRCFPRLRRNRRRVAGDSHRGVSAGCAREVAGSVPAGPSSCLCGLAFVKGEPAGLMTAAAAASSRAEAEPTSGLGMRERRRRGREIRSSRKIKDPLTIVADRPHFTGRRTPRRSNPIPVCSQINNHGHDLLWTTPFWPVDGLRGRVARIPQITSVGLRQLRKDQRSGDCSRRRRISSTCAVLRVRIRRIQK